MAPGLVSSWIDNGEPVDRAPAAIRRCSSPRLHIFSDGSEVVVRGALASKHLPKDLERTGERSAGWLRRASSGLYFYGEAIDSIYTRRQRLLDPARVRPVKQPADTIGEGRPPAASGEQLCWRACTSRRKSLAVTSVMTDPEADFWMWDDFFPATPARR